MHLHQKLGVHWHEDQGSDHGIVPGKVDARFGP